MTTKLQVSINRSVSDKMNNDLWQSWSAIQQIVISTKMLDLFQIFATVGNTREKMYKYKTRAEAKSTPTSPLFLLFSIK